MPTFTSGPPKVFHLPAALYLILYPSPGKLTNCQSLEQYGNKLRTNFKILVNYSNLILFLYFKVEDKGQALTFHYRNVVSENRQPMIEKAEQKIIDAGFMVGLADCAIECKPTVNILFFVKVHVF